MGRFLLSRTSSHRFASERGAGSSVHVDFVASVDALLSNIANR